MMAAVLRDLRKEEDVRQTLDFLRDCTQSPPVEFATPLTNASWLQSAVLSRATFWTQILSHTLPSNAFSVNDDYVLFTPPNAFSPKNYPPLTSTIQALRSRELGIFWGASSEAEWAMDVSQGTGGKVWVGRSEIDGGKHIGTVVAKENTCRIGYGGTCRIIPAAEVELLCKAPWCKLSVQFRDVKDGKIPEGAVGGGWEADQSELYIGVVTLRNGLKWVGKVRNGLSGCHIGLVKEECIEAYQVVMIGSGLRRNAEALEAQALLGKLKRRDMSTHGFFDTYAELKRYEASDETYVVGTPELRDGTESTVLLCHDMKGGYCPAADEDYRKMFTSWSKIDIFCYFSHHFIAIPPRVWIDDCAKNKTLCLGTIATEHKVGKMNGNLLLHSGEKEMEMMCDKLASMCVEFGFHGWLVNFESDTKKHGDVVKFLKVLTERCKQKIGQHARVVYYDSLNVSGKVSYQNALNAENKAYFDACDAIFTNYWFGEKEVQSSLEFVEDDRTKDVFFGVDVFSRGVHYSAGPGCSTMTRYLAFQGASVAVFAPGWTLECGSAAGKPLRQAQAADIEFWNTLFPDT